MSQPQQHHQSTTVVAILGTRTLSEDILARLLEHEGYSIRHLEAPPTNPVDDLLDGVDILLFTPELTDGVREAFLNAMRSTQESAAIPVLPFSSALKMALLDELSAGAPWRRHFEELLGHIGAALQGAAASAGVLVAEGCGAEPLPALPATP
jgi:hypothetical protein